MPGNYVLGVAAHPSRLIMASKLVATFQADHFRYDSAEEGPAVNHFHTLRHLEVLGRVGGCEWAVVLEDDALPVDDFHGQLTAALTAAPSPLVSLYNGTGYPPQQQNKFRDAARGDHAWILHDNMRHAVGYAVHRKAFETGLLDTLSKLAHHGYTPEDGMNAWAWQWQHPIAYTNPSLVDHLDGPSVIQGRPDRRRARRAHRVGGRTDWDTATLYIP